jgi:hypothetical protein
VLSAFCYYNKCLKQSTYKAEKLILAHGFRNFSPRSLGSVVLGLWQQIMVGMHGGAKLLI